MLGIKEVEGLLKKVQYKPRWKFEAYEGEAFGMRLLYVDISTRTQNPNDLGTQRFGLRIVMPPVENEVQFYEWLRHEIWRVESDISIAWLRDAKTGAQLVKG